MSEVSPQEWNSLCEVFVPVDDQGKGKIATAYPIAQDRIITCAHVLDGLLAGKTPEVRWHHLEPDGDYHCLDQEYLAFDGREHQVDVAVLRVKLPSDASLARPMPGFPPQGGPTQSMGFPTVGLRQGKREAIAIDGKILSYPEAHRGITIAADAPHRISGGWRGASGSPVFTGGRLVGIYAESPEPFNNQRLHATPFYVLLQVPEFRTAIDFDQTHPGFMRLRSKALRVLAGSPGLTAALVESLELKHVDEDDAAATSDLVFSALIAADGNGVLRSTINALKILKAKDSDDVQLSSLEDLALVLLPVVYRADDVKELCGLFAAGQPLLFSAPNSLILAEALMAGADGREMMLSPHHASQAGTKAWHAADSPGEYLLQPPPDSGIDTGGMHYERDLTAGLAKKFFVDSDTDIDRALAMEFFRQDEARLREEDYATIRRMLQYTLEDEQCHYYFVYRESGSQERPAAVTRLMKALPQIVFLGIPDGRLPTEDALVRDNLNRLRLRKVDP